MCSLLNEFWNTYFKKEKAVYEKLLADIKVTEKGTLKDLAAKYPLWDFVNRLLHKSKRGKKY